MMDDYISRKEACAAMPDDYYGWLHKKILGQISAADVVPLKRGKWKLKPLVQIVHGGFTQTLYEGYECSICHKVSEKRTAYCSSCGAKMEGA